MSTEIKFFDRWSADGVKVEDPGLIPYIGVEPKIVPKTGARYAGNRFHRAEVFIVERLASKLMSSGHKAKKHFMSSGHNTGKKANALRAVEDAFALLETKTKQNPLAVFVKAIENAAPREEVIAIEYGGARYPKAVEVAPMRRVDIVLRTMTQGAYQKAFNKKKSIASALAEEILAAYEMSSKSAAVAKKRDLERQAASSK